MPNIVIRLTALQVQLSGDTYSGRNCITSSPSLSAPQPTCPAQNKKECSRGSDNFFAIRISCFSAFTTTSPGYSYLHQYLPWDIRVHFFSHFSLNFTNFSPIQWSAKPTMMPSRRSLSRNSKSPAILWSVMMTLARCQSSHFA